MSTPRPLSGKLVIATHNAGKLKEMGELLAPYGIETVSAGALGLPEPVEDGTTFAENATIKALAAARAAGLPALADDSGLAVDELDGAPGLFTADWAGSPRDWSHAMNRVKRELEMRDVAPEGARARFVSSLVLAWPDGETLIAEGRVFGHLTFPPRGKAGFGYDPVFVPEGETRTFAELSPEEKHGLREIDGKLTGLSHRAKAFIRLLDKSGLRKMAEDSAPKNAAP
ncbi:MAG: non-canonical purine NTP pyrophosphatase [Proteobacteria bacterium]|nr:non-canonical purine NTP pyrophosphatase [Pseudomonadota bacterium]